MNIDMNKVKELGALNSVTPPTLVREEEIGQD